MPPPATETVMVAMSGGVDSSVAAALLVEQGYSVAGVTMRVMPGQGCHTIEEARAVADRLGIPHHAVDLSEEFEREVVRYFVNGYTACRTPNPCVMCNMRVKFGVLRRTAVNLGYPRLATGHYARIERQGDRLALRRALYRPKDQTYFLAGLDQEQLARAHFPLGGLTKAQTREKARKLGLHVAEKNESQEICFIPDDDYRGFLAGRVESKPGLILNAVGEELGRHTGLVNYTIGQRKGLGISAPEPLYVLQMDPERNALIVGYERETWRRELTASGITWSGVTSRSEPFDCLAQIRYRHSPVAARVFPQEQDAIRVCFAQPQRSVTPGQWAVLYDRADRYVMAAGTIE